MHEKIVLDFTQGGLLLLYEFGKHSNADDAKYSKYMWRNAPFNCLVAPGKGWFFRMFKNGDI